MTAPAVPNLDGLGYLKLLPHNFAAGHLLFMPALRALTRLVGDGLRAGRLYDALLGGTGVVLTYSIARRLLAAWDDEAARLGAAFAAGGLALSYGYWSEANDVEAYAAAMVALLATVRLALSFAPHPTLWRAAATGALLGRRRALASDARAACRSSSPTTCGGTRAGGASLPPLLALAVGGALSLGAVRVRRAGGARPRSRRRRQLDRDCAARLRHRRAAPIVSPTPSTACARRSSFRPISTKRTRRS